MRATGVEDGPCPDTTPDRASLVFVRAGVVGWRGGAILIPAVSGSGTSTLVAELVEQGATYYSDEWAVFDAAGQIHAFGAPPLATAPPHELAPLPLALVVATTFRPGAQWSPSILSGARALLPVVEHAVEVRDQPARVLRLAGVLGPKLVTIESVRPDAKAVASSILDLADAVLEGSMDRYTSVRRAGAPRLRIRPVTGGDDASPAERALPARFLRIEQFLSEEDHQRLIEFALAHEPDLADSTVNQYEPDGEREGQLDRKVRRSRTLHDLDEHVASVFEERLRVLLPHVRQELDIPWFRLGVIERQLQVHGPGDFFGRHVDNSGGDTAPRRVSAVYHFHQSPRQFEGGALCLYDEVDCDGQRRVGPTCTVLEPLDNSLVIFASGVAHEVEPVRTRNHDFGASRFAITFWCREAETPTVSGAPTVTG